MADMSRVVRIHYIDHRGEHTARAVVPLRLEWKATAWHPVRQWVLEAIDLDEGVDRSFTIKDILSWQPLGGGP